jgi:hypothetical protein
MLKALIAAVLFVSMCVPAAEAVEADVPATIRIASPQDGAVLKRIVPLTLDPATLPRKTAAVEYRVNGIRISPRLMQKPFSYDWSTRELYDWTGKLEAIALDASGKVIARSAPVGIEIDNVRGRVFTTSPENLDVPLSGKVKWTVAGDRSYTDEEVEHQKALGVYPKPVEALMLFIDGKQVAHQHGGASLTYEIDTAAYANGEHELLATGWEFAAGLPVMGMVRKIVTFDNGHTPRGIRARFSDVRLAPGESVELPVRLVYTDGAEAPIASGATYQSDNPSVAGVDAAGKVTGVSPGIAGINIEAQGHKTAVRVVVDRPHGFPHFARDGAILREYDPARSTFVRTLFFLGPEFVENDPALLPHLRAAAVGAFTTGFYRNPVDNALPDLESWKTNWDPWFDNIVRIAAESDMQLCLSGDDIARTYGELHFSVTSPWAAQALQHAFTRVRDSKRTVFVEMIDEVSLIWGEDPHPKDERWSRPEKPLPPDPFKKLMEIINGVENRTPLTWPVLGISSPAAAKNWMGDPQMADYATIYWTCTAFRRAYPHASSLPQDRYDMDRNVRGFLPVIQRDRPMTMLVGLIGKNYQKFAEGSRFTPDVDVLMSSESTEESVSAQILYAAAMGMAGVRCYGFDAAWVPQRENAPIGAQMLGIGASPTGAGSGQWQPMASAFNLIKMLEPYLLQPVTHAPDLGREFVTGMREGPAGRVLIAINFAETPQSARVDLSQYAYDGGSIVRYRLRAAELWMEVLPVAPEGEDIFRPGEIIVWLIRPRAAGNADMTPPAVRIVSPLHDAQVSGTIEIAAQAKDDRRVAKVEFIIDGTVAATLTRPPFVHRWVADQAPTDMTHGIAVVAYDASGNVSQARLAVHTGRRP